MPEDELIAQRREKLEHLHALGIEPYPHRFERTHSGEEAAELTPEEGSGPTVTVAGRVTARRGMGKASFLDLLDGSGRLQVYVKRGQWAPMRISCSKTSTWVTFSVSQDTSFARRRASRRWKRTR